jgi:hypothetical protein
LTALREKKWTDGTPWKEGMSRESIVQVLGAVVFAATVLVTVLALVHLFS